MKDFALPDMGEGITAGDVVAVHVAEGDVITREQTVVEVETDKAVVEVPCPFGGKVVKVHVSQGQKIKVGQVMLTVDESADGSPAASAVAPATAPAAAPASAEPTAAPPPSAPSAPATAAPAPVATPPRVEPARPKAFATTTAEGEPIPAGPATRRLARELGVDLRAVADAYPDQRLTQEMVKEFVRSGRSAATAGPTTHLAPLPDFAQWGPIERQPLSTLQRKTAEHVQSAWTTIPHVTQFDEADVSDLEALRQRHKEKGEGKIKLTATAFVLKALARMLKAFPKFNASLDAQSGELIYKKYYHIGMAVDTEAGLIVPVLRDVERKSVLQIAAEMAELADRTRQRKIALDELRGGTFTVTNLGSIGGTGFTPIVNYPEVAILGLARTRPVPVLTGGEWSTRMVLPLCLSYDHRVINGADGARFLRKLAELLEDPEMLLLEG